MVCEKISGYYKEKGHDVDLLMSYEEILFYDKVFISKVFTDTPFPDEYLVYPNVEYGGTGFYFDKAPNLPDEIEHHMPDYHLYDEWIQSEVEKEKNRCINEGIEFNSRKFMLQFKEYTQYSIGFMTRGCFRKCGFCVNKKYDHVFQHSPLDEFYDPSMKKICLLDDNFFGCPKWKEMLQELIDTKKPFKFKQGMDERLLTDEKCKMLFSAKYDGDYTFAFDSIRDYDLIHSKLKMIRSHTKVRNIKFYVLVGFESTDANDIENAFKRLKLLMHYECLPYIMRFQSENDKPYEHSKYKGMYIAIARWANQPSMFKKKTFREFCQLCQDLRKDQTTMCTAMKAMTEFEAEYPQIASEYFDMRYGDDLL